MKNVLHINEGSNMLQFLSITYLSRSESTICNKSSTSTWEPSIQHWFSIFYFTFTLMRHTLHRNLSNTNDRTKHAKAFHTTCRYIDVVLSIKNPNFVNWIPSIFQKITCDKNKQKQLHLPHFLIKKSHLYYNRGYFNLSLYIFHKI